ncbi:GDSL esterase/lipase At5g08460 isoform X2 [Nymphaea colorata]|uniref:GDSL esterase/lipase At5g08460 isoform X2 n=1 Tax=Nymphaea colorata TaxID=210225 RepID=UPI00129D7DD6|nr:GDSL esterase/lipase At5g08460 isoform X2 [Nymphaea colorata]
MVLSLPHLLLNISLLSAIGPQETPVDRRCVSLREDRGPRHRNSSLAPAFFIFGDSSVDVGTNNFLGTLARSDLPPYGRDFDTHKPTGRFCNGRLIVDYLALHMGLPFVPAFLGQSGEVHSMIHGVNYASSGAGILFTSGSDLGQHISLTQQIEQAVDTFQLITLSLGERRANRLFAESIFFLSVGSNDYIHHYLRNASGVKSLYLPWGFNQLLISTVKQRLKTLYTMNARRFVVLGLAPLGCTPHFLWEYQSKEGECIKEINDMIMEFNFGMRYMIDELNKELKDAMFIFCDAFLGSEDIMMNHEHYGFETVTEACCGFGQYGGWIMCISPQMACKNATTHVWWDQFHPTDAVNSILADNIWSGLHANMCHPINLQAAMPKVRSVASLE